MDLPPIFVVGNARSGTTLLQLMLNAHPRIHLTHESCFFVRHIGEPSRGSARIWATNYLESWPFASQRVDQRGLLEAAQQVTDDRDLAAFFSEIMRRAAKDHGKPRFGDKTPYHVSELDRVFAIYPGARVIHIVRDPRAVVASLCRMPWAPASVLLSTLHYSLQIRAVPDHAERICEVRYEDLVDQPEATLRRVLAFVGEPWDDRVLEHTLHAPVDIIPPFPWQAGSRQPISCEARTASLTPAKARLVEILTRQTMRRYGYEPASKEHRPGLAAVTLAAIADVSLATRGAARLVRILFAVRRRRVTGREALLKFMTMNPEVWQTADSFDMDEVWQWLDEGR